MIFIAEIGLNYNGNFSLCYELIKQAKHSGANIVKFQLIYAHELCIKEYKYFDFFKTLEMDYPVWEKLVKKAKKTIVDLVKKKKKKIEKIEQEEFEPGYLIIPILPKI